jgi:hypothetical protein
MLFTPFANGTDEAAQLAVPAVPESEATPSPPRSSTQVTRAIAWLSLATPEMFTVLLVVLYVVVVAPVLDLA